MLGFGELDLEVFQLLAAENLVGGYVVGGGGVLSHLDIAVLVAHPVVAFDAVEDQVAAFLTDDVINILENSLELLFADIGVDGHDDVGGTQVVREHRVRCAHLALEGGEEAGNGIGVDAVNLVLAVLLPGAGPGDGVHAHLTGDKLIGAGGGQGVVVHDLVVHKLLAPFQAGQHTGLQQGIGHLAVADDDVIAQRGVEAAHDGIEQEDAAVAGLLGGQAQGVLHAVAIGVIVGEGMSHVVQILHGLGHFQAQLVQPVLTHGHVQLALGAVIQLGQAVEDAVHIGRVQLRASQPVKIAGQLLVLVGSQIQQQVLTAPADQVVNVDAVHVVDIHAGAHALVEVIHQVELDRNADVLENLLIDEVVRGIGRPAVAQGIDSDANLHRLIRKGKRAQAEQHDRGEQQGKQFFHGDTLLFIFLYASAYIVLMKKFSPSRPLRGCPARSISG